MSAVLARQRDKEIPGLMPTVLVLHEDEESLVVLDRFAVFSTCLECVLTVARGVGRRPQSSEAHKRMVDELVLGCALGDDIPMWSDDVPSGERRVGLSTSQHPVAYSDSDVIVTFPTFSDVIAFGYPTPGNRSATRWVHLPKAELATATRRIEPTPWATTGEELA